MSESNSSHWKGRASAALRDEVLASGERPGARELDEAIRAGWIIVVNAPFDASVFPDLGAGEASTLCFAS